jgi:hypothetical protein
MPVIYHAVSLGDYKQGEAELIGLGALSRAHLCELPYSLLHALLSSFAWKAMHATLAKADTYTASFASFMQLSVSDLLLPSDALSQTS